MQHFTASQAQEMNQIPFDTSEHTFLACRKGRVDMSYSKPMKLSAVLKASFDSNVGRLDGIIMIGVVAGLMLGVDVAASSGATCKF